MVEQTVNNTTEQTSEATPKTVEPTGQVGKTFSQDDVNKLIADRLSREREKHQEEVKKLTDGFNEKEQSYLAKEQEYTSKISDYDKRMLGYQTGILPDRIDEALAVAEVRAKKDNIELSEALSKIASEYSAFVGASSKGGMEVKNAQNTEENKYLTPALLKRYPHLAKNQNKK